MINTTQRKALPREYGYRWKCVFDPSGLFQGGLFQAIDLEEPWESGFTEGTTFRHLDKPVIKVVKVNQRKKLCIETVSCPNEPASGEMQ